ncbi:MAG: FKBP-type peptidyl-prolyl cis-trans isomerase [Planctomycetota bacterium]
MDLPHLTTIVAAAGALIGSAVLLSKHERPILVDGDSAVSPIDVKFGDGLEAAEGKLVEVSYTVSLDDGTVIVDLLEDRKSHRFVVGDGTVIPGLELAILGMREGGIRDARLPWSTAYGSIGLGNKVPEKAALNMRVELIDVQGTSSARAWADGRYDWPSRRGH